MTRWIRILSIIFIAQFYKKINPLDEICLNFRVWITDVDLAVMNNTAMMLITELGRWDLSVRTGFLKYARKNRLYFPLASISAQFRRPLKRFQQFQLRTQIIYWDDEWIYISHRMQDVFALCDRVMVLKTGEKVGEFRTSDITVDDIVKLMILGKQAEEQNANGEEINTIHISEWEV